MFVIGKVTAAPGSVAKGALGAVELANGPVAVPVVVVNGAKKGPTAVVMAAVHGFEICSVAVAHRVVKLLDPARLSGTVVVIPGANAIAVARGEYAAWPDGENLSAVWPRASAEGNVSERMAALIWPALDRADLIIDVHSNPLPAMAFVTLAQDAPAETHRLARAFGLTTIEQPKPPNYSRGLRQMMGQKGVPSFNPEMAGSPFYDDGIATIGQRGVFNVLKAAGMLPGAPEKQVGVAVLEGRFELTGRLRVNRGGFIRPLHPPGVRIRQGDTVLEVVNILGDVVEEVKMPCDGYCWSYSTGYQHNYTAAVTEGTRVGYVFQEVGDLPQKAPSGP
jgi:predicted deacylase